MNRMKATLAYETEGLAVLSVMYELTAEEQEVLATIVAVQEEHPDWSHLAACWHVLHAVPTPDREFVDWVSNTALTVEDGAIVGVSEFEQAEVAALREAS